jgi:hypothetical protein
MISEPCRMARPVLIDAPISAGPRTSVMTGTTLVIWRQQRDDVDVPNEPRVVFVGALFSAKQGTAPDGGWIRSVTDAGTVKITVQLDLGHSGPRRAATSSRRLPMPNLSKTAHRCSCTV